MKRMDWFNISMSCLFIGHFLTMNYNEVHWMDIVMSIGAVIWLILTITNVFLKRRIERIDG